MKDITNEWLESITDEEIESNRGYLLFGEPKLLPRHVVNSMIKLYKYVELKNIRELKENYNNLRRKITIPIRTNIFLMTVLAKVSRKMKHLKDYMEIDLKYAPVQRELYGGNSTLTDLIMRRTELSHQIILFDVKLENFSHIKNDLFSAYKFDIVDRSNERIEAVYVYDELHNQFFSPKESVLLDRKGNIEMARSAESGKTWMVYAMALSENYMDHKIKMQKRPKRLYVRHIQDGGRKNKPEIPFLTIK